MSRSDSIDEVTLASTFDLTEFKYSILCMLADDPTYGLDVKRRLQKYYGHEINHGKLYPNLDDLTEDGLINKGKIDDRTNEYCITNDGLEVVVDRIQWAIFHLVDDETEARELMATIRDAIFSD